MQAKSTTAALGPLISFSAVAQPDLEALGRQVADTERAFARTMADRDHAAFAWRIVFDKGQAWDGAPP